jgi:hypothetical protein
VSTKSAAARARHPHDASVRLQGTHDVVLVLGEHLGEAIGALQLAQLARAHVLVEHLVGRQNALAEV